MIVRLKRGQSEIHFAYTISEKNIYFTSLQRSPSSINMADNIVEAICQKLNLNCLDVTFHDVQTLVGYPSRFKPGYFGVDRLTVVVDGTKPRVTQWFPLLVQHLYSEELEESRTELTKALKSFKEIITEEGVNWEPVEAKEDQVLRAWAADMIKSTHPGRR